MKLVIVLLSLLVGIGLSDINVKIDRHFPCNPKTGPKKENLLIKFPSYKMSGVKFEEEKNASGNKCYRLSGGIVKVSAPGLESSKKYYVHLETRIGINGKPEKCMNADSNGCGGIGSCVHCDICHNTGGLKDFVQIFQKNEPAKCGTENMPAGDYDDLSLRVCLPTKNEMLQFLDKDPKRAEEIWKFLMNSRGKAGEMPLVIAARLFDRPINKLSAAELNDAIHGSKEGMIGCHWIYLTITN